MAVVGIETNENAFMTTGRVEGNEIVKAEDFNDSFASLINNISKFSRMIFEADRDFVIGGKVSVYNGLNLKVDPIFGVCHSTGTPFGAAEELSGASIPVLAGTSSRIDILEVKGEYIEYDNQNRAFNDLDTDTITYQKVNTKMGLSLNFVVKQGTEGQAPDTDPGFVKLCEIHYTANAEELDDSDIFNISADVSGMENEDWTNETDSVYNIGYISDVNERFRVQHKEDGSHQENIITTKELDIGTSATQIGGHTLPSGGVLTIGDDTTDSNSSIITSLTSIAKKLTNIFNHYVKYGLFQFKGEVAISDILDDDGLALVSALKLGTDTDDEDNRFIYLKFGDTNVLTITSNGVIRMASGYQAIATTDLVTKSVTDALAVLVKANSDAIEEFKKTSDPSSAANYLLSKFTVSREYQISVATTNSIVLEGEQIIDGVSVTSDEYVLVKDQEDPKENGVYYVTQMAWQRVTSLSLPKKFFEPMKGDTNKGWYFYTLQDSISYGTSLITFEKAIFNKYSKPDTVVMRDENGKIPNSFTTAQNAAIDSGINSFKSNLLPKNNEGVVLLDITSTAVGSAAIVEGTIELESGFYSIEIAGGKGGTGGKGSGNGAAGDYGKLVRTITYISAGEYSYKLGNNGASGGNASGITPGNGGAGGKGFLNGQAGNKGSSRTTPSGSPTGEGGGGGEGGASGITGEFFTLIAEGGSGGDGGAGYGQIQSNVSPFFARGGSSFDAYSVSRANDGTVHLLRFNNSQRTTNAFSSLKIVKF